MHKAGQYILLDLLKNKVITGYFLLVAALGWGTFLLENQPEKALLILMQVVLILLPMIALLFASIYYYNSHEFIELLLSQPIGRFTVFKNFYLALNIALLSTFFLGLCLPILIYHPSVESLLLISGGVVLNFIFIALALCIGVMEKDKVRGMGYAILLWALFAFVYDGFLLLLMHQFSDYPIEKAILVLSFLNPIDLVRIIIIMKTETSAMLGLSGAVFLEYLGTAKGILYSFIILICWVIVPFFIAGKRFKKKDL